MVLKLPANLLAGNDMTGGREEGRMGRGVDDREAKMERKRDGKGDNEEEGGRQALVMAEEWVGGGGAIDGKDERDGGKQQLHFYSLPKGPLSMTHDDRRQNGHPNKHQSTSPLAQTPNTGL